jgi:hypothetical protein
MSLHRMRRLLCAAFVGLALGHAHAAVAATPAPRDSGVLKGTGKLSSEEVKSAITWGRGAARKDLEQYELKVAPNWTVNFDTPFLRVAQMAHAWKQNDMMLSEGDVPAPMLENDVHLYALAVQQPGATGTLRSVQHVTMVRPGGIELIQPKRLSTNLNRARRRDDYAGVAKIAQSVTAVFAVRDFLPGNEIRILFEGGERETLILTKAMLAGRR